MNNSYINYIIYPFTIQIIQNYKTKVYSDVASKLTNGFWGGNIHNWKNELKELKRPMVLTILPSTFLLNKPSETEMNLAIHSKYVFPYPSQYLR